jgi:hypothetical protein
MDIEHYWWVIIPLAAFTIPLAGIAYSSVTTWLLFRHRREAMDLLRTYAQQGKDPPPELLAALGRRPMGFGPGVFHDGYAPGQAARDAVFGYAEDARAAARAARHAARAERLALKAEYRIWRSPIRRWNRAIFMIALAGGLYGASLYAHDPANVGRFQIGAIILGALAAAALLSAVLATVFGPK